MAVRSLERDLTEGIHARAGPRRHRQPKIATVATVPYPEVSGVRLKSDLRALDARAGTGAHREPALPVSRCPQVAAVPLVRALTARARDARAGPLHQLPAKIGAHSVGRPLQFATGGVVPLPETSGVRLKRDGLGDSIDGQAGAGTRHHPEVTIVTGAGGGGVFPEIAGIRLERDVELRFDEPIVSDARAGALHHPQVKIVAGTALGTGPVPEMARIRLKRDGGVGMRSRNAYPRRR